MAAGRLDLRNVGGRARRHDGRARTASTTSRSSSSASSRTDAFRPRAVWQFPGGLHDYTLPSTIAERIGSPVELGSRARRVAEIELVVYATDVSDYPEGDEARDFELEYSSRTTRARADGPRDPRVGRDQRARAPDPRSTARSRRTAAGCATSRSSTRTAIRTSPRSRRSATSRATRPTTPRSSSARASGSSGSAPCLRCGRCSPRCDSRRSAPSRGEPAHYGELIVRLMRVAFARNAVVEERLADERETSVQGAAAAPRGRDRSRDSPPRHRGVASGSGQSSRRDSPPRASRSATTATSRHSSCAATAGEAQPRPDVPQRDPVAEWSCKRRTRSSAATPSPTKRWPRIPRDA